MSRRTHGPWCRMLVLTLGDPHSVNVECLAACMTASGENGSLIEASHSIPVVLVGSYWHWQHQLAALERLGILKNPLSMPAIQDLNSLADFQVDRHGVSTDAVLRALKPGFYFWDVAPAEGPSPGNLPSTLRRGIEPRFLIFSSSLSGPRNLVSNRNHHRVSSIHPG